MTSMACQAYLQLDDRLFDLCNLMHGAAVVEYASKRGNKRMTHCSINLIILLR